MFVPYNAYSLRDIGFRNEGDKIVKAGHLDPTPLRYELHRVWELEGKLRPEFRHINPLIYVYVDEDSWEGVQSHRYDVSGNLWRVYEGHTVPFADPFNTALICEPIYDLLNGRYVTFPCMPNKTDFSEVDKEWFTPQGIRVKGVR